MSEGRKIVAEPRSKDNDRRFAPLFRAHGRPPQSVLRALHIIIAACRYPFLSIIYYLASLRSLASYVPLAVRSEAVADKQILAHSHHICGVEDRLRLSVAEDASFGELRSGTVRSSASRLVGEIVVVACIVHCRLRPSSPQEVRVAFKVFVKQPPVRTVFKEA